MSDTTSKSNQKVIFEDDEVFDDYSFMADFENASFKESVSKTYNNINNSHKENPLNVSALCCDEEISGYDKLTGKKWIYPTNYPVRDYQFNIIKATILKNTLVSLPTGLGKTFIAAVIMYNFYRWYPLGKILFMAPTRPLVAQQIDACYNIIAIPPNDTIEMTGHMPVTTRKNYWNSKRVFFATPQVIYNDIKSGICLGDKIRCLVIDEAHKARGNYAYCQIISTLTEMGHRTYRILALSATPGSKVEDVINVVKNLHIAHLELRTENCIDVAPYSHSRKINTEIIKLGPELTQLRQQYVEILDGYARRLKQLNILPHNLGNLSKGRIVMLYKEFQSKDRSARHPQHSYIMKDFTLLIALYHGLELLVKHGSRVFLNFFDEHPEKSWMQSDVRLTAFLERLRDDLGINPLSLNRSILPDGTIPEMPQNLRFGHPKFDKLKEIMMEHFSKAKKKGQNTKAIVFCEYRESVNLVHCLLLQCRPLITAQMFVGQGASGKDGKTVVSQKQQLRVMRSFREGSCNTLVATSVAEEGLDVGNVDLILCFDISTRSPIRLVQRCGRTGRERGGQVYILVTEGREHQTLLDCMRQRDGLNSKILQSKEVENNLYKLNPRMIPHEFNPECQKMHITVAKKNDTKEKSKENTEKSKKNQGQKDLRTMLIGKASSSSLNKEADDGYLITEQEFNEIFPYGYNNTTHIMESKEYFSMSKGTFKQIKSEEHNQLKLSTWLEWQRTLQKTVKISHSEDTEILVNLLQYCDVKRFEIPASTQNPTFHSLDVPSQNMLKLSPAKPKQPKKKQKVPLMKSPSKRDGDIRALFSTSTKSTKNYTKLINDLGIQNDGKISTNLISLLVDLSLENMQSTKECYICQSICRCSFITNMRKYRKKTVSSSSFINNPMLPDINLISDIDLNCIQNCFKNTDGSHDLLNQNISVNKSNEIDDNKSNCNNNFELGFDFHLSNSSKVNDNKIENKTEKQTENIEKNFDIGDIEDIFADSSPEEAIKKEVVEIKDKNTSGPKDALDFFGLDSIDDIFADSDDDDVSNKIPVNANEKYEEDKRLITSNSERPVSPSILSGKQNTSINRSSSPILCTQARKFKLSMKKLSPQSSTPVNEVRRHFLQDSINNNNNKCVSPKRKEQAPSKTSPKPLSSAEVSDRSMLTITQIVEMINKTDNEKSISVKPSNSIIEVNNNSSKDDKIITSPILLTQADRKKSINNINKSVHSNQFKKAESLIILDSDSDSDNDTRIYELEAVKNISNECEESFKSLLNNKRKYETDISTVTASPYFNKRQKLDSDDNNKPLTLQEKVLAAITSSNVKNEDKNENNFTVNFMFTSPKCSSQKENLCPNLQQNYTQTTNTNDKKDPRKNNLEMLQMFKQDSKVKSPKNNLNLFLKNNTNTKNVSPKCKITFDDSDDDFIVEDKSICRGEITKKSSKCGYITKHKVRKKKKKTSEFLDLEAELSDDGERDSGDELSDDSAGSIVDFICDENVTHNEDMQAHYLKSVKSPIKGTFKIPYLPNKYNKMEVFSQYVEEDTYEMDSFCVDSHIGLTQVNNMSELELAEIVLEEKIKTKRKLKNRSDSPQENGDSPVVIRKNKNAKRRINSDSDDSS